MEYKRTTQVPNFVFDNLLPVLSECELKVLLVIIRQTAGWINLKTGKRKSRDRISHSQFQRKTGYSRRMVSLTIRSLVEKQLITVTDRKWNILNRPEQRKGKSYLFFAVAQSAQVAAATSMPPLVQPTHEYAYGKAHGKGINSTKRKRGFSGHVGELFLPYQSG